MVLSVPPPQFGGRDLPPHGEAFPRMHDREDTPAAERRGLAQAEVPLSTGGRESEPPEEEAAEQVRAQRGTELNYIIVQNNVFHNVFLNVSP